MTIQQARTRSQAKRRMYLKWLKIVISNIEKIKKWLRKIKVRACFCKYFVNMQIFFPTRKNFLMGPFFWSERIIVYAQVPYWRSRELDKTWMACCQIIQLQQFLASKSLWHQSWFCQEDWTITKNPIGHILFAIKKLLSWNDNNKIKNHFCFITGYMDTCVLYCRIR